MGRAYQETAWRHQRASYHHYLAISRIYDRYVPTPAATKANDRISLRHELNPQKRGIDRFDLFGLIRLGKNIVDQIN